MNFSVANVIASSLYHRTNINCRAINDHITCLELITVSSQQANNFREFMYVYIHTHTHIHTCPQSKERNQRHGGGGTTELAQKTCAPENKWKQRKHRSLQKGFTGSQSSQLRNAKYSCRQTALFKSSFFFNTLSPLHTQPAD